MKKIEIHLNSSDGEIQVWGYEPFGGRTELQFLIGLPVIQHFDHFKLEKVYLFEIMTRLLKSGQEYTITVDK